MARQVRRRIGEWIFERVANPGLGPEADDPVEVGSRQRRFDGTGIAEIQFVHAKGIAEPRESGDAVALERDRVVIVKIVEDDDFLTALEQAFGGRRADEPGTAR